MTASETALQGRPRATYSSLSESQKWLWHTDVYAFRRIVLGVSRDERTSPFDPDGAWFDELMVDNAESAYRVQLNAGIQRRQKIRDKQATREGRSLINEWARQQGCATIEQYAERERIPLIGEDSAYTRAANAIVAAAQAKKQRSLGMGYRQNSLEETRAALGLAPKKFNPTPEQMAEGRRQIGLEGDQPQAAE